MEIYGMAWKNLEKKIAATRRQSIRKADLTKWQLEALEEAIDQAVLRLPTVVVDVPDADFRDE